MKLRKQLFTAFLAVAVLPLLVVSIYLFGTNIALAFNLYEQNLLNSTEMQADLVEESLNRMMVRAGNFSSARSVRDACLSGGRLDAELSAEILKFTDETLDSISIFALLTEDNKIIYSSGSNNDTEALAAQVAALEWSGKQSIREIPLDNNVNALAILSPVMSDSGRTGGFLVLYRPDYFLKTISSHKQMEGTNSFLYCLSHGETVVSKVSMDGTGALEVLEKGAAHAAQGALTATINGGEVLCYYRTVPKTTWVLVNSIPTTHIFYLLWDYGFASIILLVVSVAAIFYLSRRESRKILKPLETLLGMVERFFVSGAEAAPMPTLDPKTEIGYLAGKFAGMSNEIAAAQGELQESNYLYQTLLSATYELRITVCFEDDVVFSSSPSLTGRLQAPDTECAAERLLRVLAEHSSADPGKRRTLRDIVTGHRAEPMDVELCCCLDGGNEPRWYRMLSVPIVGENGAVRRVVLHFEDINVKKQEEFRLIRSSQVDPLCGLLNRTAFFPHCMSSPGGTSDAVFFIDLDRFKQVNDLLGHAIGDEVLVSAANVLRAQFRSSDVLGRYGGDEFVVFAPNMTYAQAENRAKRLVQALIFDKQDADGLVCLHVSASVGVCVKYPELDLAQALITADEAMYHAKQTGPARYHITEAPTSPAS